MAEKNEQIDAGMHGKQSEVLRARDIIPGAAAGVKGRSAEGRRAGEVPSFDLAERIMAEQRKASAVKRKGPGRNEQVVPEQREEPSVRSTRGSMPIDSGRDEVIAEIVKKDIERLCRGEEPR